ncbi:MAG: ATP-binding protein [Oscillospiraceae bacterium]|jgi:predicted AAA+ superfamily ATPase|nr:ATP-binding protein [Oscillospiraceae bacterium]
MILRKSKSPQSLETKRLCGLFPRVAPENRHQNQKDYDSPPSSALPDDKTPAAICRIYDRAWVQKPNISAKMCNHTLIFSEICGKLFVKRNDGGDILKRSVLQKLIAWKSDPDRKPCIIKGARQVGKTWLMKEFGENYYDSFVYFNFDEEDALSSIFETNKNPERIIELLGLLKDRKILPGETLVIFDEIQECSAALNALKYFREQANEYHILAAGSLLGTLLAKPKSYPVGMVNLIDLFPLSFDEFLAAVDEPLYEFYSQIKKAQPIEEIFHSRLLEAYSYYLIMGGLPECVASWIKHKDPQRIRKIQNELVSIYENDFAKHNGKVNSGRILMVFRGIVSQLAKSNEKFIYGSLKTGGRAREFKEAIEWLVSAGMINRLHCVTKPEHPLPAFDDLGHFKLFLFDTGLLKHMAGIDNAAILLKSDYQFKGPLTENFVLQQLRGQFDVAPRFYADRSGEIDFLIQNGTEIIPVEVKGGEDKSAASFKAYIKRREPANAIRFSKRGFSKDGAITNLPLYLAGMTRELI